MSSSANYAFAFLHRGRTMPTRSCFSYSNSFSQIEPKSFQVVQSGSVVDVRSTDQLKSFLDASKFDDKLLVMEFMATWCKPCKQIEPYVKQLAANFADVRFVKIDVDNLPSVAQQFEVYTLPMIVFVKKGKEVDKVIGVARNEIWDVIEKYRT